MSVTPIRNAAGKVTHYVGIQSDITELVNHRKAELAAKHAALQVCTLNPCAARVRVMLGIVENMADTCRSI